MDALTFLADFGGIILGAVLLGVATVFLPAKARSYVLTGGIAVLVFRSYQVLTNRRRLAAADAKRRELREEAGRLEGDLQDLRAGTEDLRRRKREVEENLESLRVRKAELEADANATEEKRRELNDDMQRLEQQRAELAERRRAQQEALNRAAELARRYAQ